MPSPPQPQYSPNQHMRPREKKARSGLLITIIVVAFMLALLGFAIGVQNHLQPATSKPATSTTNLQQPTPTVSKPTPQPAMVLQAIGKSVVVNSTWTIKVNGARTSPGDRYSTPSAGNIYLVVDVTVKNTSRYYQDMLSGNQLVLKDNAGQQYREAITDFAIPPDGEIRPHSSQRGQLAYEIPATMNIFSYYFQTDANGTNLTEWVLHV